MTSGKSQDRGFGDEMIEDLQALADTIEAGEPLDERFTVRAIKLDLKPREYRGDDVKAVRAKLGASQALLARFLGVSVQTLQKWERGTRPVPTIAARYLDDVQEFPDLWTRRIERAAK